MEEKEIKKRKSRRRIGILILLLAGLAVLFYPVISTKWNDYRSRQLASSYKKSVQEKGDASIEEMKKEAQSYNQTLFVPSVPDAFSIRDGIHDPAYEALLNPDGDGVMANLEIPAIHVDLPIYHYTSDESLSKGAGHLFGSSLPIGGKGTHAVISAHRGLPSAKLFTDLDQVGEGDCFYLYILDKVLAYQVDQVLTVLPEDSEALAIDPDKDLATLVTCTPYGVNTHRLLVRGHRIPYTAPAQEKTGNLFEQLFGRAGMTEKIFLTGLFALLLIIAVMLLIYHISSRKKKR